MSINESNCLTVCLNWLSCRSQSSVTPTPTPRERTEEEIKSTAAQRDELDAFKRAQHIILTTSNKADFKEALNAIMQNAQLPRKAAFIDTLATIAQNHSLSESERTGFKDLLIAVTQFVTENTASHQQTEIAISILLKIAQSNELLEQERTEFRNTFSAIVRSNQLSNYAKITLNSALIAILDSQLPKPKKIAFQIALNTMTNTEYSEPEKIAAKNSICPFHWSPYTLVDLFIKHVMPFGNKHHRCEELLPSWLMTCALNRIKSIYMLAKEDAEKKQQEEMKYKADDHSTQSPFILKTSSPEKIAEKMPTLFKNAREEVNTWIAVGLLSSYEETMLKQLKDGIFSADLNNLLSTPSNENASHATKQVVNRSRTASSVERVESRQLGSKINRKISPSQAQKQTYRSRTVSSSDILHKPTFLAGERYIRQLMKIHVFFTTLSQEWENFSAKVDTSTSETPATGTPFPKTLQIMRAGSLLNQFADKLEPSAIVITKNPNLENTPHETDTPVSTPGLSVTKTTDSPSPNSTSSAPTTPLSTPREKGISPRSPATPVEKPRRASIKINTLKEAPKTTTSAIANTAPSSPNPVTPRPIPSPEGPIGKEEVIF